MSLEQSPIIFSSNGFEELESHLKSEHISSDQLVILVDANTSQCCLPFLLKSMPSLASAPVFEVEAHESSKNLEVVKNLYLSLTELGANRDTVLINLGGGVVTDIGGFVASTFKRGIRFINIPTTLLAQIDASIGGKNGVNLEHFKNMVGTFAQPSCVFVQSNFLNTLPKNQIMSGYAELIKHALVADADLWEKATNQQDITLAHIKDLIEGAANIKARIVAEDYHENGQRKKLNFGHTIGHALETFSMENSGRDLLHGEAVALGMLCEAHISQAISSLRKKEFESICNFIGRSFKPYQLDKMSYHRVIEIMNQDKKKRGKKINMTLLTAIGEAVIDQEPRTDLVIDSLNFMNKYPFS